MIEIVFLFVLALIWILFALVQDMRTTEIANWLNISLVIFALGFRFFYSLFFSTGFDFFYQGLIGLAIFYVLGNLLYNAKMFAGGDAKLFVSLGAVLPISGNFIQNISGFLFFLLAFFVIGAIYSIIASIVLGIQNYSAFRREFRKQFGENKKKMMLSLLAGIILIVLGYISLYFFFFGILAFILPYLYLYAKAVDEAAMVKEIRPEKLREGDWLYKDAKAGKRIIRATWDGLSKQEILLLKKYNKKVWIRTGVPFTAVFFFTAMIYFYFLLIGLRYSFW